MQCSNLVTQIMLGQMLAQKLVQKLGHQLREEQDTCMHRAWQTT